MLMLNLYNLQATSLEFPDYQNPGIEICSIVILRQFFVGTKHKIATGNAGTINIGGSEMRF
jgi:hypothetical protein